MTMTVNMSIICSCVENVGDHDNDNDDDNDADNSDLKAALKLEYLTAGTNPVCNMGAASHHQYVLQITFVFSRLYTPFFNPEDFTPFFSVLNFFIPP